MIPYNNFNNENTFANYDNTDSFNLREPTEDEMELVKQSAKNSLLENYLALSVTAVIAIAMLILSIKSRSMLFLIFILAIGFFAYLSFRNINTIKHSLDSSVLVGDAIVREKRRKRNRNSDHRSYTHYLHVEYGFNGYLQCKEIQCKHSVYNSYEPGDSVFIARFEHNGHEIIKVV